MSYDIHLDDPVTGETCDVGFKHEMTGGTYCVGGTREAWLNITYNYGKHYYRVVGEITGDEDNRGIRHIYGMSGAESMPFLEKMIERLGNEKSDDYWEPTEGNAKAALYKLHALASLRPDGIWGGD